MNTNILLILTFTIPSFLQACSSQKNNPNTETKLVVTEANKEVPYNDKDLLIQFTKEASLYYKEHGGTNSETYKKQILSQKYEFNPVAPSSKALKGNELYSTCKKGVLMMGILYRYNNSPETHIGPASAFVISEDGICVSNYHVFESYDPQRPNNYITAFVMDSGKNTYPVIEMLAASKKDDIAVFRIDTHGRDMHFLSLGEQQVTGDPIRVISHPDYRFYTYSQGHINRTYVKPGTSKIRQSISADFAKGSSGAPVFDSCGNVVGIVAGTQNIYYDRSGDTCQMTIKEIIPVSRLKALFE